MSSTTESVESVQSLEVTVDLETVLTAMKQFGAAELFKVIKTATTEAEKRVKNSKVKKEEDGPKKPTPSQLQKPTAWVRFTLKHAQEHGWEEFIIHNRKSGEEILMPASEEKDGKHVYPGGKEMILTHAMSLSKQRWAPKAAEGTHEELYNEFLAEFEAAASAAEAPEEAPEWLVPPTIVRKTAEEKAAEMEAKKAEIEAKKAEKKEERERAKAEAKAAKEAEKAEAKAAKEAEKAAKVPKAAVKAVVKAAPKPVAKAAAKVEVKVVEVKASGKEEATTPRSLSAEPAKTPARKPATANANSVPAQQRQPGVEGGCRWRMRRLVRCVP
jgi:hypothetical protein